MSKLPDLANLLNQQASTQQAAAIVAQTVSTQIGAYAERQKDAALAAGDQATADKWKEGGEYRIAMHIAGGAAIAGLGGGSIAGGAAGAGISAAAAGMTKGLSDSIAASSPTGNADADRALGNIIANVIATGAGAAVGGSSGAAAASSVDLYNGQKHRDKVDERPGHENTAGNDVNDNHLNILPTAGGAMSKDAKPETFTVSGGAGMSTFDTSVTRPGSKYLNVDTNVSADQFTQNLISNGYRLNSQGTNKNGDFSVLSNGSSTYTIYTRSSTGEAGAQYFGPNGASSKFNLKGK